VIVVGVDGSEGSADALRWALEEAHLRKTEVLALHAWAIPAPPGRIGFYAEPLQDPEPFREGAEQFVAGFVRDVAGAVRDVSIAHRAVLGSASEALIEAAKGEELLVVGSRGHGGFSALLLGSVSQQCAAHAECPVVVVHRRK
jgi:nucleotide-binding universal stress UspA family protein